MIDLRNGKKIYVPGLNLGAFLSPLEKGMGEGNSVGQEHENVQATLLAGSDAGTSLISCCGTRCLLFWIWFYILGKSLGTMSH